MARRGCAAKLPAQPLAAALDQVNSGTTEDAAIPVRAGSTGSVDGFPALVSDPWLNGRLTTLHACSDLWACVPCDQCHGSDHLPMVTEPEQQELLVQTLAGMRSASRSKALP